MSDAQPLAGRSLWLAGIGGAGMSAYALLARGWGAQVSGWDRAETPYLAADPAGVVSVGAFGGPNGVFIDASTIQVSVTAGFDSASNNFLGAGFRPGSQVPYNFTVPLY